MIQQDQTRVQVSSAPGSAGLAGARGGRAGAGRAPLSAAGVDPDPQHLLSGARLFAPAGRADVPGFPWRG